MCCFMHTGRSLNERKETVYRYNILLRWRVLLMIAMTPFMARSFVENAHYVLIAISWKRSAIYAIKFIIALYVARPRNGRKASFSESFHPFCAERHKLYIYHQYTNIVFILQKSCKKRLFK
jgi:hypothetical protein